jgi:hypothetical protein
MLRALVMAHSSEKHTNDLQEDVLCPEVFLNVQAAQARTHTSNVSKPRDSILEYDVALMPMAHQLQVGQPPFTTDGVATPTSSQEVSVHSFKLNLEIETQQTQQTHLYKPTGLGHEEPGIQCMLCPCPAM